MSEAAFDELIHAPLRLQICAMLSPVRWLPFADIRDSLEVSDSVLSKHLSALAGAGYVEVSRVRADSRSRRQVTLTKSGRTALRGHLAALRAIAATAEPGMSLVTIAAISSNGTENMSCSTNATRSAGALEPLSQGAGPARAGR